MLPKRRRQYARRRPSPRPPEGTALPDIIIASDSDDVRAEVRAAIEGPGTTVREFTRGREVLAAVRENVPDLAVLDLQIGKMGAMATCLELRLEESGGRLPHVRVLMLLDRRADVFLARRSDAEGWVVKPLDSLRLKRAVREVLAGRNFYDETYRPVTVPAPTPTGEPDTSEG